MHNEPTILAVRIMATTTITHAPAILAGGPIAHAAGVEMVPILTDYTEHGGAVVAALEDIPGTRGSLAPFFGHESAHLTVPPAPVAHLAGLRAVAPPHAPAAHGKPLLGEGASSNADLADAPQYPPLSTSHLRWRRSRHARLGDTCRKRVDADGSGYRGRGCGGRGRVVANRAVAAAAMLAERDCPPAIHALATSAHGSRGPLFFAKGLTRFIVATGATTFRIVGCHDCSRQERELVNKR